MADKSTFDISDAATAEKEAHAKVVQEFELRRKAKQIVVPTDDGKVRTMLRQLSEPITLFGEKEMERRERLRRLLALQDDMGEAIVAGGQLEIEQLGVTQTEKFYTEGPPELPAARNEIAQWSLRRAAARLSKAKRQRDDESLRAETRQTRQSALLAAKHMSQQVSEIGDDRPISGCEFSPDSKQLATCGWGGTMTCWNVDGRSCTKVWSVRAHDERCTGIAWHPSAGTAMANGITANGNGNGTTEDMMDTEGTGGVMSQPLALATASVDNTARLFDHTGKLLRTLSGHTNRLARLAFHPMGKHLATASWDMTWRFWDVETGQCLVEQEGHSREVYAVGFHPDGSLAASAGLDAIGRIWDCRTGRSPFALEGHVKQILCLDFSPSGVQLATGSDDHTCKVWDLRQRACIYTIPAHTSLVSSCRYEKACGGGHIVTGGYDCLVKVWSAQDFKLVKTLAGHEGKVMSVDVTLCPGAGPKESPEHVVASVAYDRTLKLWAPDHFAAELGAM